MKNKEEKKLVSLTDEKFNELFEELVDDMDMEEMLSIGDIVMILKEHLNNDVIKKWEEDYPNQYFELNDNKRKEIEITFGHDPKELPDNIVEQLEALDNLDREEIIFQLESVGTQCYDDESTEFLRTALLDNICNGDVDLF